MASDPRQPANPQALIEAQDRFVAVWGQMGAAWGISRTMAEVHALLFITGRPMNTDDIMERLQISRGNASMSLRALLDWGTVARTHKRGDRKEYFVAEQDVWAMFRAILRERMKREVDPMLASLFEIRDLTGVEPARGQKGAGVTAAEDRQAILEHNERLDALLGFFKTIDKLSQRFVSPSGRGLQIAATMLNKVV
jgi:HTH-type transcriptional regulator, glycine betaine synthesis regulator